MESIEERLELLEQTVKAYREFLTHVVKLLLEKEVLSQEELHEAWAGIISSIREHGAISPPQGDEPANTV